MRGFTKVALMASVISLSVGVGAAFADGPVFYKGFKPSKNSLGQPDARRVDQHHHDAL